MSAMPRGYIRKSFHVVIVPPDFQIEAYQFVGLNDMITAIDHGLENFFCVAFFACRGPARNIPNRDFYGRSLLFGQGHGTTSVNSCWNRSLWTRCFRSHRPGFQWGCRPAFSANVVAQ